MFMRSRVLIVLAACCLGGDYLALSKDLSTTQGCFSNWTVFSSKPYGQIALPDTNVEYRRLLFSLDRPGEKVALLIKGKFPKARYFNFNLYNVESMDSLFSTVDQDIKPNQGSSYEGQGKLGDYTFVVSNSKKEDLPEFFQTKNFHYVPIEFLKFENKNYVGQDNQFELWYREYLPEDPSQVEAPQVFLFTNSADGMKPKPCMKADHEIKIGSNALHNLPVLELRGKIEFYRTKPSALYANKDNDYLLGRLNFNEGELAIVQFKAPKNPLHNFVKSFKRDESQVRYWSMCLGGTSSRTSSCIADQDVIFTKEGLVTFVIGPDKYRRQFEEYAVNYMATGSHVMPFLVYRNLLSESDFQGTIKNVSFFERTLRQENLAASHFISSFAPQGLHCSIEDFQNSHCSLDIEKGDLKDESFKAKKLTHYRIEQLSRDDSAMEIGAQRPSPKYMVLGASWDLFLGRVIASGLDSSTKQQGSQNGILKVARHLFGQSITENKNFNIASIFESVDTIAQGLGLGLMDAALIPPLALPVVQEINPRIKVLVHGSQGLKDSELDKICMIQRANEAVGSLKELKGKRLVIPPLSHSALISFQVWLATSKFDYRRSFSNPDALAGSMDQAVFHVLGHRESDAWRTQADITVMTKRSWKALLSLYPSLGIYLNASLCADDVVSPGNVWIYDSKTLKNDVLKALKSELTRVPENNHILYTRRAVISDLTDSIYYTPSSDEKLNDLKSFYESYSTAYGIYGFPLEGFPYFVSPKP